MSGIARLFLSNGAVVSGSDLKETKFTEELKRLGAGIFIGHNSRNIQGADLVVYSSAIKDNNPEIQEANLRGIPVIKRAQALAELMKDKTVVTVTGSHGKTTTTSLVSCLLIEAGFAPTVAIGGILRNINNNACLGRGEFFVAEADESDGSFLYYRPRYSIITNIDYEHLDYYKEFKNAVYAFKEFLNQTDGDGCAFCCYDDENMKGILKDYKHKYVLFGLNNNAHIYPKNIQINGLESEFDCFYNNKFISRFYLALGGTHNISNALSVIALGLELGIDLETIKRALIGYQGAGRRLEVKFKDNNYLLIDDYAHHPTEIRATLSAVKNLCPKRIIAVFQPHRYSRTKLLLDRFSQSFDLADCIIITDIYSASEPPLEGITGGFLAEKIKENLPDKKVYYSAKEEIAGYILGIIKPGDLVITLGAGDITKTCDDLAERLTK